MVLRLRTLACVPLLTSESDTMKHIMSFLYSSSHYKIFFAEIQSYSWRCFQGLNARAHDFFFSGYSFNSDISARYQKRGISYVRASFFLGSSLSSRRPDPDRRLISDTRKTTLTVTCCDLSRSNVTCANILPTDRRI
ncbi:hypothetical protein EDD85DRAFT_142249 [Armillaria nabsnona]|nr:hypothetical protein EDD85DRAFT_142249 [Armillaria nabsnona]